MSTHPVTLFTGQWADLPFEEVARLASSWGYDGLEIAASGDHLDLRRADEDDAYLASRLEVLDRYGLKVFAISNHLAGQAVCDAPIDFRHQAILRDYVWGDGDAEGVRQRAAEDMKRSARVARKLGIDTVVGFTGSSIWQYIAMFPPVDASVIERGFDDFAQRWNPILDVFDAEGVRFAHEVHPSEIAYDYWSAVRTLDAIGRREAFGRRLRRTDLSRRLQRHEASPEQRPCGRPRVAPAVGRPETRMGLRLDRARRCAMGRRVSRVALDRIHRPDLRRMGGRGHGPAARRGRSRDICALAVVGPARRGIRLGVLESVTQCVRISDGRGPVCSCAR